MDVILSDEDDSILSKIVIEGDNVSESGDTVHEGKGGVSGEGVTNVADSDTIEATLAIMHGIEDNSCVGDDGGNSGKVKENLGDPLVKGDNTVEDSGGTQNTSKVEQVEPTLEEVFGKGATKLAITFEESSKGKRIRDEVTPRGKEVANESRAGNISTESKKPKLGVMAIPSLGKDTGEEREESSDCSSEKEQLSAPPGDI